LRPQSFRSDPQTGEIVSDVQLFRCGTIGGWTTVSRKPIGRRHGRPWWILSHNRLSSLVVDAHLF